MRTYLRQMKNGLSTVKIREPVVRKGFQWINRGEAGVSPDLDRLGLPVLDVMELIIEEKAYLQKKEQEKMESEMRRLK